MKTSTQTNATGPVHEIERHADSNSARTAERALALGGLWWAVLFITTFALAGEEPPSSAPMAEIRDYFASFPGAATVTYGLAGIGLVGYLAVFGPRLVSTTQRALGAVAISGAAFFLMVQTAGDVAFLSLTYGSPNALSCMKRVTRSSHTPWPSSLPAPG